jgi:alanyl-tRNA synthetase
MTFQAVVTDIRLEARVGVHGRWQMSLDRTEFRPGDMGIFEAVTRSGTRLEIPVLGVLVEDGVVWHLVEKPLAAGTDVECRVVSASLGAEHEGAGLKRAVQL